MPISASDSLSKLKQLENSFRVTQILEGIVHGFHIYTQKQAIPCFEADSLTYNKTEWVGESRNTEKVRVENEHAMLKGVLFFETQRSTREMSPAS